MASLSGLRIWHCLQAALGHRYAWIWCCHVVAWATSEAPIQPLAQELPYAANEAVKKKEEKIKFELVSL